MAGYILPDPDEDALHEAGIELEGFRLESQRLVYGTILDWIRETRSCVAAMAEARSGLMDACVYGDYRSQSLAANLLGKTIESSTEMLLAITGQLDSPLQIKASLEDESTGRRSSPIADALWKLDGQSRENLRNAFLTLLTEVAKLQVPPVIEASTVKENADSTSSPVAAENPPTPAAPIKRRRPRRARKKRKPARKKPAD